MKQAFVTWEDRFSIGVDIVDEQHRGLFNLTNDLYDAYWEDGGVAAEYFKEVLQKAVSYVLEHFNNEENIMKKTNDPNYEAHQAEHGLFVKNVMKEAASLGGGDDEAPELFVNFLRDWISNHVTVTDIKIGQHIAALKAKGELAPDTTF